MRNIFEAYNTAVNITPAPKLKEYFKFTVNSGSNKVFNLPERSSIDSIYLPFNIQWHINWGDGSKQDYIKTRTEITSSAFVSHTYPEANKNYQITISPINEEQYAWMLGFGVGPSGVDSDSNSKIMSVDSPITLKAICINDTTLASICLNYAFTNCYNLIMGPSFNLPQDPSIISCDETYQFQGMFTGCPQLEFNNIFTLPKYLTSVGNYFAANMFGIVGSKNPTKITDLKSFRVPQGLQSVGLMAFSSIFIQTKVQTGIAGFFGSRIYSQEMLDNKLFQAAFAYCNEIQDIISPNTIPALTISKSSGSNNCFLDANSTAIASCPTGWK